MSEPLTTSPDDVLTVVAEALPTWLPAQRWFGGKNRPITAVRPVAATTLLEGDPLLVHLVVEVEQGDHSEAYQLLVGSRQDQLPDVAASASIGALGEHTLYEASGDADLTSTLLDLVVDGADLGDLSFRTEPGAEVEKGLRAHPITSEQSNTSLVYGQQYILKLFRKLVTGDNPDLRLHRALREVGCTHIAEPLGSITGVLDGEPATIALLQRFLPDAADGWVMATTSVRDFMADPGSDPGDLGGDFGSEAERLGAAIATVHADLARALGTESVGQDDLDATVSAMTRRLARVAAEVPEIADHVPALERIFQQVADLPTPLDVQNVHGDLHLGQVLRTLSGWIVLDFEGEPAASITERQELRSTLRDVAGVLRSFDYAAQQMLVGEDPDETMDERAMVWAEHNRSAFCDGYAAVAGTDPRDQQVLLRALELDKAVYEVGYEHANRPDWLGVPLASIARLVDQETS